MKKHFTFTGVSENEDYQYDTYAKAVEGAKRALANPGCWSNNRNTLAILEAVAFVEKPVPEYEVKKFV